MKNINKAAALNGATLTAFTILATEKHALPRKELVRQLDFCLEIQRLAPYHPDVVIPDCNGEELLQQTLDLEKFTVSSDEFGEIISLDLKTAVEMTYYRNNILHTFIIQAAVASIIMSQSAISEDDIIAKVKMIYPLLRTELYLWPNDDELVEQIQTIISALKKVAGVKLYRGKLKAPDQTSKQFATLSIFASCIQETMQRFGLVCHLLDQHSPISRKELEVQSSKMAERLGKLHGIDAPEFYDKGVFSNLTNTLRDIGYIAQDEGVKLVPGEALPQLTQLLDGIIDPKIIQTLREIN